MNVSEILIRHLTRRHPQTQDECVAIAVRQSLAMHGEMADCNRCAACYGLAKGLFGPAFKAADLEQKLKWFKMAKRQYQIACDHPSASGDK